MGKLNLQRISPKKLRVKYTAPPKIKGSSVKVLFFDIETFPIRADVWDIWQQNVSLNQIVEDWSVLSWSAKWQGKSTVMYDDVRGKKNRRDDRGLLKGIHRLLNEADVVIGQNSKRFDEKKLNARFIFHGIREPDPFQSIDTLQIAKQRFKFTSNRLQYLAEYLGVGHKLTERPPGYNGHSLWRKCDDGEKRAYEIMEKYNKMDTIVLEKVWEKLSPWARGVNYLNRNLYVTHTKDGKPKDYVCQCGSIKFQRNGHSRTTTGRYLKWRCSQCGANHREKGNGKNHRPQSRGRV